MHRSVGADRYLAHPVIRALAARFHLVELTRNGQWAWDECKVLRHFLQIPLTSEKRQHARV